jgi:protein-tyrosine kinase
MNIIEEASKRLEQLGKAGIEAPVKAESRRGARVPAGGAHDKRVEPSLSDSTAATGPNYLNIDFQRLQANGIITPAAPDMQLLHEFRVIKRPLIRNALGKSGAPLTNGNLIMVTSALPGEGKTFVALNLAMSIAMEVDSTVLLVDADVVAPSIPRVLGVRGGKGVMDVLTDPSLNFGDVMLKTNVNRLALVPAGTPHRRASELLASDAMAELLDEVSRRYADRIVIFDSPPLLDTTESRVLASHMGQVVVVVEADRTTHGTLENALSTVETCPVVLTMLNKAGASDGGSYYGYYG